MTDPIAAPIKVIEFPGSGIAAAYAGWLLAGLGADVVRFADDEAAASDPIGLALAALAIGKRELPRGTALEPLLGDADVLLCDDVARLAELVGRPEQLAVSFPSLIVAAHSVFGLTGPLSDAPAVAIDALALSGLAWALGDPDRSPLSLPPGIAEHQGGAMLAAGVLLAQMLRDQGAAGELIDIALADVLASYVAGNCRFYIHHGMEWHRSGQRASSSGGAYPYVILPCADGEVCICGRTRDEWNRLVSAMGNPDWASEPRYQDLRAMGRDYPDEVDALIRPWLATRTMAELEAVAIANNLIMSPVRSLEDVLATPGFIADGYLKRAVIAGRDRTVPTLPFRVNEERAEGQPDLAEQLLTHAPAPTVKPTGERPLAGMRVIDFGWVWSAPWVGTILGELGAEVIKVEHGKRPDNLRLAGRIFRDGVKVEGPATEMSPMYHQVNHGKLGITLNVKEPRAVELIMELVAGADLVIENMSPGSLERSGLGYSAFKQANPRLVMLAMSAAGQFGALSGMRAYAPTMSSFAGMEALVGYPGEAPIGALNVGLGDPNASVHGLVAALAALRFAKATGRGSYIDLSQVEALTGVLLPYLLASQKDGAQPEPTGNRHPSIVPHGIFPALGDDRWLTLAASGEIGWRALVEVAAGASWSRDPRFADAAGRLANIDALENVLAAWTATHERDELVATLRRAGVAASPVLSVEESWRDPNFVARQLGHTVEIPFYGPERLIRAPWRFAGFDAQVDRPGPMLGEHNRTVFGGTLGLADDEIDRLVAQGVMT